MSTIVETKNIRKINLHNTETEHGKEMSETSETSSLYYTIKNQTADLQRLLMELEKSKDEIDKVNIFLEKTKQSVLEKNKKIEILKKENERIKFLEEEIQKVKVLEKENLKLKLNRDEERKNIKISKINEFKIEELNMMLYKSNTLMADLSKLL